MVGNGTHCVVTICFVSNNEDIMECFAVLRKQLESMFNWSIFVVGDTRATVNATGCGFDSIRGNEIFYKEDYWRIKNDILLFKTLILNRKCKFIAVFIIY